jgi:WD40-like Beta Propeller Repeat
MARFLWARSRRLAPWLIAASLVALVAAPAVTSARAFGEWGTAVLESALNSAQADGCPIESFDGLSLYLASTRPGAVGGDTDPNDIWVANRASIDAPWQPAVHLPAPVNSAAADFCPLPLPGNKLFFVSSRGGAGACGAGDIYRTRNHPVQGWLAPTNLGCVASAAGPNFAGGEFSPSLIETDEGTYMYFSSTGLDGLDQDIYVSARNADGSFGPPSQVNELSTGANDQMPNVSRDGLEIVFVSDRTGGAGGLDVYTAHRATTADAWSAPTALGAGVNTSAGESRPSLSGDGERLHFGRLGDIWVSTRSPVHP